MQSVDEFATAIYVKPKVDIDSFRGVTISPLSHVGVFINDGFIKQHSQETDNPLFATRLDEFSEGVSEAFYNRFVKTTVLNKPISADRNIDFIIDIQVTDITITERTTMEPTAGNDAPSDKSLVTDETDEADGIEIPIDYLTIKMTLKDARSQQVIDIAQVKSRSGQVDYHKGYSVFAAYSMQSYLNTITQ